MAEEKEVEELTKDNPSEDKSLTLYEKSQDVFLKLLKEQFALSWEEQKKLIRSDSPQTRVSVMNAVRVAQQLGLPLNGIDVIHDQVYVNAEGIRCRLALDSRGIRSNKSRPVHFPTKDEPWVVFETVIVMGDGSEFNGFGSVNCSPSGDVGNSIMKSECVPLDSEILTRSGFRDCREVVVGEDVLAYDVENDRTIWTPLLDKTFFDGSSTIKLISDKGQFEMVCTPDHTWAVNKKNGYKPTGVGKRSLRGPYKNRSSLRSLVKTVDLKTSYSIILSGYNETGSESLLTDDEAAVLGWVVTDGTIHRDKVGKVTRVGVCQSKTENFDNISRCIQAVDPRFYQSVTPSKERTFPSSGKTYATMEQHWWYLTAEKSRCLLLKAGYCGKESLPSIVTQLSSTARKSMLQAMMLADGDKQGNFACTDKSLIETVEILCALEGIATGSEIFRENRYRGITSIRVKKTRHAAVSFLNIVDNGRQSVWCPTTALGTWVMRQNNRVMITGNTKSGRRAGVKATATPLPIAEDIMDWLDEQKHSKGPTIEGAFREVPLTTTEPTNLAELLAWAGKCGKTMDDTTAVVGDIMQITDFSAAVKKLREVWRL